MLMPALAQAKANEMHCLDGLKQIGLASGLYGSGFSPRFPPVGNLGHVLGRDPALRPDNQWEPELLERYLTRNGKKPITYTGKLVGLPA